MKKENDESHPVESTTIANPHETDDVRATAESMDQAADEQAIEPYIFTDEDKKPIYVKEHWSIKILSGVGIALFSWFIIIMFIDYKNPTATWPIMLFFMAIVLLNVYLWIYSNSFVLIDDQKIQFCLPKGSYQMLWREVKTVYSDGFNLVFSGYDKWLLIPWEWVRKKNFKGAVYVSYLLEVKKIPYIEIPHKSIPKKQHNCKIK